MEKRDIFDKLMALALFRSIQPFYMKYKSVLLYLFFGGLTTLVSICTFGLCEPFVDWFGANVISWICAVSFAYVTNRIWVFTSREKGIAVLREIGMFFAGRLLTLALEQGVLYLGITLLFMEPLAVKVLAQVIVLILNYVISKLIVFRK